MGVEVSFLESGLSRITPEIRHYIMSPPNNLRHIVKCFWSFEFTQSPGQKLLISTFANNYSGITFISNRDRSYVNTSINGKSLRPENVNVTSDIRVFGVHFYEGVIPHLFRSNASAFTDTTFALSDLSASNIPEAVYEADTLITKIDLLSEFIKDLDKKHYPASDFIQHCLRKIQFDKGHSSVKALTQYFNISERQLERKFSTFVGVSPQLYIKIARFQEVIRLIRQDRSIKLLDAAHLAGYYDQPHFNREVKDLSAYTPKQLQDKIRRLEVNQRGTTSYLIDLLQYEP